MSGKSYAFTIRPKNGLSENTEEELIKYLKKQHHAFAVIEGCEESRHSHGQVWFEHEKTKGDFAKALERICERTIEDWNAPQKKVLRGGVKFAYNDDFTDNYCQKEKEPNIIFNNPPEDTDGYYPSQEDQNKIKESANAVDKRFHRWLVDFKESKYWINEEWTPTLADCARFLSYKMFETKEYAVVVEKRKRVEYCKCLFLYANSCIRPEEFLTEADHAIYIAELEAKYEEM